MALGGIGMEGFVQGARQAQQDRQASERWDKLSDMWDQDMETKAAREEREQKKFGLGLEADKIKLDQVKKKAALSRRRHDFQNLGGFTAMNRALKAMNEGKEPDPGDLKRIAKAAKYDQSIELANQGDDGPLQFVSPKHGKSWNFQNPSDFLTQISTTLEDPDKATQEMFQLVQDADQRNNYIDMDSGQVEALTPYQAERDNRNLVAMDTYKQLQDIKGQEADVGAKRALIAKRIREARNIGQQDWEKITDRDGKRYWVKPGTNERIELGVDGSPTDKDQPAILQETDALFQNILQSQGLNDSDLDEGERAELWLDAHTKASSKGQSDPREAGATFYKGIFNRLLQYGEEPQSAEKVAQDMTDGFLQTYYDYKPPISDARKREIKDYMKKHIQQGDIPVSKLRKRALDLGLSEKDLQEMGLTVGDQSKSQGQSSQGQSSQGQSSQGQSSQGAGQDAYSDLRLPNPTTDWRTYADMPPMNPPAGGNRQ